MTKTHYLGAFFIVKNLGKYLKTEYNRDYFIIYLIGDFYV